MDSVLDLRRSGAGRAGAGDCPGQARVVVRGGTMSLEVRDCTLTQLLSLIAARTGIRIAVSEAIPPVAPLRPDVCPIDRSDHSRAVA